MTVQNHLKKNQTEPQYHIPQNLQMPENWTSEFSFEQLNHTHGQRFVLDILIAKTWYDTPQKKQVIKFRKKKCILTFTDQE